MSTFTAEVVPSTEVLELPTPEVNLEDLMKELGDAAPPAHFHPESPDPLPVWTDVTPEVAKIWRTRFNTHNRSHSGLTSGGYTRDIATGAWNGKNGQTITFCLDPRTGFRLVDGQHRLKGIEEGKVTVRTLILWGVPDDSQETIDMGRARKFNEQLSLGGESHSPVLGATLRRGCLWAVGGYVKSYNLKPTRAEQLDFLAAFPQIRGDVQWGSNHKLDTGLPPTISAFARWLFRQKDDEAGRWFMDRLCDREMLPGQHPIQVLHKRILRERNIEKRYGSDEYLALAVLAWNAFRNNKTTTKLQMPSDGLTNDTFPLPI